jgi:hypothetical protein
MFVNRSCGTIHLVQGVISAGVLLLVVPAGAAFGPSCEVPIDAP